MMTHRTRLVFFVSLVLSSMLARHSLAADVRLQRAISHEDAKFEIARSHLTIGCDGRLYG
jgi:hypothetical protein